MLFRSSVVLGGPRAALQAAGAAATQAGAQWTPLVVDMASHTPWMQGAAERFARHLAAQSLADPVCRLATNAAGLVRRQDAVRHALARQLDHTVAWDECQDALLQARVGAVLEIGAGSALSRQLTRREPALPVRALDDFRSLAAVQQWLRRWGGD